MIGKSLLSRDGRIGRHFIWNTIAKRSRYSKFKRFINAHEISERENIAESLSPKSSISKDGFLAVPSKEVDFLDFEKLEKFLSKEIKNIQVDGDSIDGTKKQLLTGNLYSMGDERFEMMLQMLLSEEVIAKVSKYLGVVPVLTKVDLWLSRYSEDSSSSQLFHLDWEDSRQVKMFINFSDVTEDNGPFTAISENKTREVVKKLGFNFLGDYYLEDSRVSEIVKESDKIVVTGKKGDVVFADASNLLHYGSRIRNNENTRMVMVLQFLRPQSFFFNWKFQNEAPYKKYISSTSTRLQKLVLGEEVNV